MFSFKTINCLTVALVPLFFVMTVGAVLAANVGKYEGELVTKWDPDGRHMYLNDKFSFVDHRGARWVVPKGAKVDGASIPQSLWSVIGGPFSGKYRAASVIHDYYCDMQTRSSKDVHMVFHDAMLASGVSPNWAKILYNAVDWFGPSWTEVRVIEPGCEVLTKDNIEDCAENMVAESATRAREPSAGELSEFFNAMRSKGLSQEVEELQRRMK